MARFTPTHFLTATRSGGTIECTGGDCPDGSECVGGVCVDPLTGAPIDGGTETVVDGEPVRYQSGGRSFVRAETGERIEREDRIKGMPVLANLEGGDGLALQPIVPSRDAIENLEVRHIRENESRDGMPDSITIRFSEV